MSINPVNLAEALAGNAHASSSMIVKAWIFFIYSIDSGFFVVSGEPGAEACQHIPART
jgi:hypothetical protein